MNQTICMAVAFIFAIPLYIFLIRGWNRYRRVRQELQSPGTAGAPSHRELLKRAFSMDFNPAARDPIPAQPASNRLAYRTYNFVVGRTGFLLNKIHPAALITANARQRYAVIFELILIALWALFVGKDYLRLDPYLGLGVGNDDFLISIFPYFPLQRFWTCGDCILWNGLMNGGSPTFGDSIGAVLHPVMFLLVIFFGTMNAIKLAMVASLMMGGWAVWWIARVLRLGFVARMWSALFAVVGGHLAGPLFSGDVGIIFSTAAASLAIAPGLALAINGGRRNAIIFGLMLGQALLAGQGYLQLGLVLGVLPVFVIFILDRRLRPNFLWKEFALAFGIAGLVAAPIILSVLSMSGHLVQPYEPRGTQSLEYLPLNLVIRDMNYFASTILEKLNSPNIYLLYIGWLPVILAFLGWGLIPREQRKWYLFFVLAIANLYLIASSLPFNWLREHLPDFLLSARNLPFMLGLAVTLILGLAAWTVDLIWHLDWPAFYIRRADRRAAFKLDTRILIPVILILAVKPVFEFNQSFRNLTEWPVDMVRAAETLESEPSGWVRPVYGNWTFVAAAVNKNVKITDAYRIWELRDVPNPPFSIDAGIDPEMRNDPGYYRSNGPVSYVLHPENPYASISTDSGPIPCEAHADGGHIDVKCNAPMPGQLIVYENAWPGWTVSQDDQPVSLTKSQWLQVTAPEGEHNFKFRFRPFPAIFGMILALLGFALSFWLWSHPLPGETRTTIPNTDSKREN